MGCASRKSGEMAFRDHALRGHRKGLVAVLLLAKSGDDAGDIALPAYEIERLDVLSIVEPAFLCRVGAKNPVREHCSPVSSMAMALVQDPASRR